MRRLSIGLGIVLLPFIWTCCPTIWLQVNKDSPSPWPSIEVVGVDPTPYPTPASMPNRFDVFANGNRTIAAADFTDAPDPKNDRNGALADALNNLAWIEAAQGSAPAQNCEVPATLRCANSDKSGLDGHCHELVFEPPVGKVESVVVKGRRLVVLTPPGSFPARSVDLSGDVPGTDKEPVKVCIEKKLELSRTLLSFIHLSDVQLRDPSITLSDRGMSRQLDRFDQLASFEYDEDLAYYNPYLAEAMFATINATVKATSGAERPRFVIHTGDSIDSGAMSELKRFHVLIDRLEIPFFEMFGNHDVLVFGNLTPTDRNDDQSCTPIAALLEKEKSSLLPHKLCVGQMVRCPTCVGEDERDLVARPTQAVTRQRFMATLKHDRPDRLAQLPPASPEPYCPGTAPEVRNDGWTRAHGFDLGTANDSLKGDKLGYYAFVQPLAGTDRRALFVALNSEDLADGRGGIGGRVGPAQYAWLKRVLACVADKHPRDLVFVFAHQPIGRIRTDPPDGSIATALDASKNVVGFFYGHSHWHSICGEGRPGTCSKYWEVETASLVEFPQEGRIVRIKQISDDLAYLELTALRERFTSQDTELARNTALARRGAERDFCHTKRGDPNVRCSADQRPYRTDGRDANARLFFRLP